MAAPYWKDFFKQWKFFTGEEKSEPLAKRWRMFLAGHFGSTVGHALTETERYYLRAYIADGSLTSTKASAMEAAIARVKRLPPSTPYHRLIQDVKAYDEKRKKMAAAEIKELKSPEFHSPHLECLVDSVAQNLLSNAKITSNLTTIKSELFKWSQRLSETSKKLSEEKEKKVSEAVASSGLTHVTAASAAAAVNPDIAKVAAQKNATAGPAQQTRGEAVATSSSVPAKTTVTKVNPEIARLTKLKEDITARIKNLETLLTDQSNQEKKIIKSVHDHIFMTARHHVAKMDPPPYRLPAEFKHKALEKAAASVDSDLNMQSKISRENIYKQAMAELVLHKAAIFDPNQKLFNTDYLVEHLASDSEMNPAIGQIQALEVELGRLEKTIKEKDIPRPMKEPAKSEASERANAKAEIERKIGVQHGQTNALRGAIRRHLAARADWEAKGQSAPSYAHPGTAYEIYQQHLPPDARPLPPPGAWRAIGGNFFYPPYLLDAIAGGACKLIARGICNMINRVGGKYKNHPALLVGKGVLSGAFIAGSMATSALASATNATSWGERESGVIVVRAQHYAAADAPGSKDGDVKKDDEPLPPPRLVRAYSATQVRDLLDRSEEDAIQVEAEKKQNVVAASAAAAAAAPLPPPPLIRSNTGDSNAKAEMARKHGRKASRLDSRVVSTLHRGSVLSIAQKGHEAPPPSGSAAAGPHAAPAGAVIITIGKKAN
jgi:hypothetical protein